MELLVSLVIIGIALSVVVGTLSTGLLDSTLAKRNTAVQAVVRYELDEVAAKPFSTSSSYSECFATESATNPVATAYQTDCPAGPFTMRADVSMSPGPSSTSEIWTVTVVSWPDKAQIGSQVQKIKVNR